MTDSEQITALAKLDGWTKSARGWWLSPRGVETTLPDDPVSAFKYLNSYDAILPLILKQTLSIQWYIFHIVGEIIQPNKTYLGTPRKLAKQLLKARNLWTNT